jgi:hypothetical protein
LSGFRKIQPVLKELKWNFYAHNSFRKSIIIYTVSLPSEKYITLGNHRVPIRPVSKELIENVCAQNLFKGSAIIYTVNLPSEKYITLGHKG